MGGSKLGEEYHCFMWALTVVAPTFSLRLGAGIQLENLYLVRIN